MIEKESLIGSVEVLMELEKSLAPLLNRHISSAMFFSGLKEAEISALMQELKNRAVVQSKHIEILKGIKEEIARSKNNVF